MTFRTPFAEMLVAVVAAAAFLGACDSEVAPPTTPPKPAERRVSNVDSTAGTIPNSINVARVRRR